MSTELPTIALVHGAFAESSSWDKVIDGLYHHGSVVVGSHNHRSRDVVAIANPLAA